MDFFFNPRGIALIGASPDPVKGGNLILKNLIYGFKHNIYPVNPRYREIEGLPCYPSILDVPDPVDLAIIFTPAPQIPLLVEQCITRKIQGAIIESGGFAEIGTEGRHLQEQLTKKARETGFRLWGPNCIGLVDGVRNHNFTFLFDPTLMKAGLIPGDVSFIVQSGFVAGGFIIDIMTHASMGIGKVCSIGNKMDITECDLLPYLLDDIDTKVIGLYLESFSDGRKFAELCRRSQKPIVIVKGGKSKKGAKAAMSHTASLAGNHKVSSGVMAQMGVIEAQDFRQMSDICRCLAAVPPRAKGQEGRIAVITSSGGNGILATDFIEASGLPMADLSEATVKSLENFFPEWMPVSNPIDIWAAVEKHQKTGIDVYHETVKSVLADPGVDGILIFLVRGNSRISISLSDLALLSRNADKPIFIWTMGNRDMIHKLQQEARDLRIPLFQDLQRTVECMKMVFQQHHDHQGIELPEAVQIPKIPSELKIIVRNTTGPLDEFFSKRILAAYGIPTVDEAVASSLGECREIAENLGYPVVMKGLVPGGVHKTELGLVHLNVSDDASCRRVYKRLIKGMDGKGRVLMQKQLDGRVELIVGLLRDGQFGPCVMLGVGGVMSEVINDTVFAMAPLTGTEALEMIGRLRSRKLLDGFRGSPPVDRRELATILMSVGLMGIDYPRIREVDINPLILTPDGLKAVDATIVTDEEDKSR